MVNRWEKVETVADFIFLSSKITVDGDSDFKRCLLLGRKGMTNLDSILKSRDITLLTNSLYSQNYGFPSSHVWMWQLDRKEGWAPKNWCFQIVLEKILESPLDCKEIKSGNPKGNKPWIFIGRIDTEAPILWLPDAKSRLIGKDPDARKDWRQKEKREAEDKVVE